MQINTSKYTNRGKPKKTKMFEPSRERNLNSSRLSSMTKKYILHIILLLAFQIGNAQCAMCKAVVENGDSGLAKGLNNGIVTLMVIPYILVAIVAFFFWKNYKKTKE